MAEQNLSPVSNEEGANEDIYMSTAGRLGRVNMTVREIGTSEDIEVENFNQLGEAGTVYEIISANSTQGSIESDKEQLFLDNSYFVLLGSHIGSMCDGPKAKESLASDRPRIFAALGSDSKYYKLDFEITKDVVKSINTCVDI